MGVRIRDLFTYGGWLAAVVLAAVACGGAEADEADVGTDSASTATTVAVATTTAAPPTTTVVAPAPTTTTTTTAAPTTTVPEETTTTMEPFNLASLSAEEQDEINYFCAWATEVPRMANGQAFGVDSDRLRLQVQTGEMIEPFLAAAEGVDLADIVELRGALAGACDGFGSPTEEYLGRFS